MSCVRTHVDSNVGGPLVRRTIAGLTAFLSITGALVVLPVYAAPVPGPRPVPTSMEKVDLGSVVEPEDDAVVVVDGEVKPDGVTEAEAAAQDAEPTAAPTTPPAPASPTAAPGDGEVVTSGDELPAVPALTVSRPDTDAFSAVGVTWQSDPDIADVVVQLRTKSPHGSWSEWTSLQPDDIEQTRTSKTAGNDVRDGTAPYWTGPSRGVEVIVQGADGAVPRDVQATLLDPGSSPADSHPAAAAPTSKAHAAT